MMTLGEIHEYLDTNEDFGPNRRRLLGKTTLNILEKTERSILINRTAKYGSTVINSWNGDLVKLKAIFLFRKMRFTVLFGRNNCFD